MPPYHEHMEPLVSSAREVLAPVLDRPYVMFGHSLGALVAFDLCCRLQEAHQRLPKALVVSAASGPNRHVLKARHLQSDEQLVDWLKRSGGPQTQVLDDPELRALLLPKVRAELSVFETWDPARARVLDVPLIATIGADDPQAPGSDVEDWKNWTSRDFELRVLGRGHFYFMENPTELMDVLSSALRRE
jgi:surfactin synthase thioesterase subunit